MRVSIFTANGKKIGDEPVTEDEIIDPVDNFVSSHVEDGNTVVIHPDETRVDDVETVDAV
jgi:hypothetical protein